MDVDKDVSSEESLWVGGAACMCEHRRDSLGI